MKRITILIVLLYNLNLFSQTYVLDNTFGDSGIKQYNKNIHIINGLLVNNNYYFISVNTILKMNYDGQIVTTFGTNGYKELQGNNETLTISDFLHYNNYLYVYGSVKNNTTNNTDIYISKIDESGNYDTSFGTNGILKLDFGLNESISRFLIEQSGNLYCIGTRINQTTLNTKRLILFKVDSSNGSVNTLFNSNGFQEINLNLYTSGAEIIPYNNDYMILGTTTEFDGTYNRTKIIISEIDINGNINNAFGTNGFKTIPLANQGVYYNTIKNVQLLNNTLYFNMNQGGFSINDNQNNLLIYDLATSQIVSSVTHNQYFYNKVTSNGVFLSRYCFSCCGTTYPACDNTFELRKMNLDGTVDTSFHINGIYSYEFTYAQPFPNNGDSRSYVIINEPDGKFLIAGFVYNQFSTPGFSAIRIAEGALGINDIELNKNQSLFVYPNPVNNMLQFQLPANTIISKTEIIDISGKTIVENIQNSTFINIENLAKGIYILKVYSERDFYTSKFVKE